LLAELFRSNDFVLDEEKNTYQIGGITRSFTRTDLQTTFGSGYFYQIGEEIVAPGLAVPTPVDHPEIRGEETLTINEAISTDPTAEEEEPEPEEETLPETLTLSTPMEQDEAPEETPAPTLPPEETAIPRFTPPDLLDIGSDIRDEDQTTLPDLEETDLPDTPSSDVPSPEPEIPSIRTEDLPGIATLTEEETPAPPATDTPEMSLPDTDEDDLLNLLDLDEDDATAETPQETATPLTTEPKTEREDDLLDLLDLGEEEETPADPFGIDLPSVGTAAAGAAAAGAALLADETTPPVEHQPQTPPAQEDEDIFDLLDTDSSAPEKTHTPSAPAADLPDLAQEKAEEPAGTAPVDSEPFADYRNNAEMIGITSEEYIGFLKQFTEESLGYEPGLKSQDLYVFKKNLTSIKDASQLLHLPRLSETINKLEEATSEGRHALIDDFFSMIHHIRRDLETQPAPKEHTQPDTTPEPQQPAPSTRTPQAPDIPTAPAATLDSVEPIPFDFSTKAASDELGLPEALVQEFVSDFVKQAEENITVFQDAQQKGDIDTIQKTAHLLKGAASNLRIDPLAETLKALQYNEDPQKVPDLFTQFIGQLKSLIHFTNATDK